MLFYNCEKCQLTSLYLLDFLTASVTPISLIAVKGYIGDFSERLLVKPSLVKIGPKVSRSLLGDLGMLHCIRRNYIPLYVRCFPENLCQIDNVDEEV
jgi:hypothetical protein